MLISTWRVHRPPPKSSIHAGSEGFSESMDRYVKPHGGLRIANYGDVVTYLGYGKAMKDGSYRFAETWWFKGFWKLFGTSKCYEIKLTVWN